MLMPSPATTAGAPAAPAATPPFLAIEGIGKRYGGHTVLHAIDLTIGEAEFVALLGPSGCGKTTLLRILCGIEAASAGRIRLRGDDITALPPAARGFGVVFQSYALFPNLTAAENVAYGLHGMPRAHREPRVREMLDLVGLGGLAGRYPAQLSGGQQQRIALARALAPNPRLVLLDEPLSALDAQVRGHLRQEIRAICTRLGVATVMVTHDQEEAMSMADRVVLMQGGRIAQVGTPATLYALPCDGFVAGFVGRMNLWPAIALGADAVRIGSVELDCQALPPGAARPGTALQIGIRPEQLRVTPHDPAWDRAPRPPPLPANTVVARVTATQFYGAHYVARLASEALQAEAEVSLPTAPDAEQPVRTGDRVRLHLPAAALLPLPAVG